jgi:transcription elongation factor GreA
MPEKILKTITELLNEEKWTRATLNSYSINNFQELDGHLEKLAEAGLQSDVLALCEEHLGHTRNSIIALYLSGIISLSRQLVDDSNLIVLINIFMDNHKWNIVEYLCKRILEYVENKFALRTLAQCYESKNEEDNKYQVWERLIKVDYEEADIVKLIAIKKEAQDDLDSAIEYYKKALHRYINKKMFANVREIWEKLIGYIPDDFDFFFSIERKTVKILNDERAADLLNLLYPHYIEQGDYDIAIEILKRVLEHEPKNADARKEIVSCFKEKYKGHSQLEEYVRISNLSQSWRNVHDAIADFEKHISFDTGNFVFHRSWGIGKIINIKDDLFIIDFATKPGHKMSLKMAVKALKILGNEHIWVLKAIEKKEELRERVKSDPAWALRTVIKSYDNVADMKKIKEELCPDILSPGEWSKWSTEARRILKTDPRFGNLPYKLDKFVVREKPISFEEKTFNKFTAEKNFFGRVTTIQEFLEHSDPDSDYFAEMFAYFNTFLKSFSAVTENIICSYLLVQKIVTMYPHLNPGIEFTFAELFEKIDNPAELFSSISDTELKREFLLEVKKHIDNWNEIFAQLFYQYQSKYIVDELVAAKQWDILKKLFAQILSHYREYREPFIWLSRNLLQEPWFERMDVVLEKVLIGMIHLLDITFREINNRRDVSLNRKLNKHIQDFLFKDERLMNFLLESGEDSITRLYVLVDEVKELSPSVKINLKHHLKEKFPNYKFFGEAEKETISRGMLVSRSSYESKQKELRHIIEVDIPENSKEIGIAMSKGDLRENAEYKAALEKQELLKSSASKLQVELQNAQIFDKDHLKTDIISFGTRVKIRNMEDDTVEEYVILGPWESKPEEKIISYLSPFGAELWNHNKGDALKFVINEQKFHYLVEDIAAAEQYLS